MKEPLARIFGLFELDLSGTILYSRLDADGSSENLPVNLVGLNFFDEIAPFGRTEELRSRFRSFANGTDSADNFTFTDHSDEQNSEVKVLLTQISKREYKSDEKIIIVDIRRMKGTGSK